MTTVPHAHTDTRTKSLVTSSTHGEFMKTIPLTQGMEAIVDDENYRYLSQYKWHAYKNRNTYYAKRDVYENGTRRHILMHRVIAGAKDGDIVDHRNHNGLDNQKSNLRVVSNGTNIRNSLRSKGSSGYFGVTRARRKFRSTFYLDGQRRIHLGVFTTPEEAARAYDSKCIELGYLDKLNFPQESCHYE